MGFGIFSTYGTVSGTGTPPASILDYFRVDFDFSSSSPIDLKSLVNGDIIREIKINIETAFNGGASLTCGFPTDPDELVESGEVDMTTVDEFVFTPLRTSTTSEDLKLYLSGTLTVGAGFILIGE